MSTRFAYEEIAADLTEQVKRGTLRAGERIPSVRRMSAQRAVSVSTVLQAYRLLEARRVLEARPQSGFYVLAPRRTSEPECSAPPADAVEVATCDLIAEVMGGLEDPELVPLGAAVLDASLLPAKRLARLIGQVSRREPARGASYATPSGVRELRREIARREWEAGSRAAAEDVVVTTGATEALVLALRSVTEPGDAVAVESPAYFGVLQAIEGLGLRALEVATDAALGIRVEALEKALSEERVRACILTPNFQNPLGSLMPEEGRVDVVELLMRREIPIIEDDTFGELHFGPARPRSLRALDRSDLVIRCGSFSKTIAPGYRLGWAVPGPRFRARFDRLRYASTVSAPAPTQLAVAEYLRGGGYDHHLRRLRRTLRRSVERLACEVAERFPEGTRVSRPAGGFVLWVQLPEGADALRLHRAARSRGISISPGPIFSARGDFSRFVRLSAGYAWSERTERAVEVLAGLV